VADTLERLLLPATTQGVTRGGVTVTAADIRSVIGEDVFDGILADIAGLQEFIA
jgi:hypothetical protein